MDDILVIEIIDNKHGSNIDYDSNKFCDTSISYNFNVKFIQIHREGGLMDIDNAISELTSPIRANRPNGNTFGDDDPFGDDPFGDDPFGVQPTVQPAPTVKPTIDDVYASYYKKWKVCIHSVHSNRDDVMFLFRFLERVPYLKNITIYADPKPGMINFDPTICVPDGLLPNTDRVLNIVIATRYDKRYVVHQWGMTYTMLALNESSYSNDEELACNWWFEHYINKLSGCMSGRLIQNSGTCYLNTVVNGFIFSPTLRKLCMEILKNSPVNKLEIKKDIFACIPQEKTADYFFHLLYAACCKKMPIPDERSQLDDIFIEYAKKTFTGEGGSVNETLTKILDYLQGYYGHKLYFNIMSDNIVDGKTVAEDCQPNDKIGVYKYSSPFHEIIPLRTLRTMECCHDGRKFFLEFAVLVLFNDTEAHSVVCIICEDGIPRIYDSGTNRSIVIDWTHIDEVLIRVKILNWINRAFGPKFFEYCYISSAVYVLESEVHRLKGDSMTELCIM